MMKKLLVLSAIILCFATLNENAIGQTKSKSNFFAGAPGEKRVEMQNQSASSDGQNGTLIEWQTSYEVNNLGFNVYRLNDAGKRVLVNENIVAGSAMMFGNDTALKSGFSYSLYDKKGSLDNQYVIEAVTTDEKTQNFSSFNTNYFADFKQLVPESASAKDENVSNLTANNLSQDVKPAPLASEQKANSLTDQDTQRMVAAQPGVKITVCDSSLNVNRPEAPNCKGAGLYRISKAQLQAGGFDVTAPVSRWTLYSSGIEQAINVLGDIDANGILSDNGFIEFYGRGTDTLYTNAKTYYLIVGAGNGKRMRASNVRALPTKTTSPSYPAFAMRQDKASYAGSIFNNEASNFFGPLISNGATGDSSLLNETTRGARFRFNLNAVNTQTPAVIEVSAQGLAAGNHTIEVYLNETLLGNIVCFQSDGTTPKTCVDKDLMRTTFTVPGSLLVEGSNIVKFVKAGNPADGVNFVEYVKVTFGRGFRALNNSVAFTTINGRGATVGGFTNQNVRVFDIADQNNVGLVKTRLSSVVTNGTTTFNAFVQATRARTMFAVADDAVLSPLSIVRNEPSDLLTSAGTKDLVIVAFKDWIAQAEELAVYRRGQGLTASVVDIEDVFDEFSFGESSAFGIKEFVRAARPKNVLLFGDATIDARNFLNNPRNVPNFIPTTLVDTGFSEVPSDDATVDFNNDGIGDVNIGRLSAVNATEAQTQVTKIKNFETGIGTAISPMQQRGVLFIADEELGYDFINSNNELGTHLMPGTTTSCINYKSPNHPTTTNSNCSNNYDTTSGTATRDVIIREVNKNPFVISYAGHGTNASWSGSQILTIRRGGTVDDTANFTNGGSNLSLFIMLTCLNGSFADFSNESISERQMKHVNGGGIGFWSSSGLTIPESQDPMGARFYDLYRDGIGTQRLGELTRQAKLATGDPDVRYSWVLLGDPTLRIK